MQMSGDSLTYTDLDSLVRMYQEPIFYNEGNRQYAADSIYAVIRDKRMQKAHLLSNAFITIQEDTVSYDQIRGAEMVAYFDSTSALVRFDALGGASSLFFLEENGALATVNKVDAKMIYATFAAGKMERIFYYDNPKNDGYPSVQLPQEERQLKGFRWEPERRPASPQDVTSLVPRRSERSAYLSHPHTEFTQTNLYFPGYIKQVYREIAIRDSLAVVREREAAAARAAEKKAEEAPKDTLAATPAALTAPVDSLKAAPADTTLVAPADTLAAEKPALTPAQQRKLEREARKAQREARWAELDRRDAERKAAREAKKLQRERERKLRALRKLEKRAQRERALLEKYLKRYRQKQKH